jgi:hypothetical protein
LVRDGRQGKRPHELDTHLEQRPCGRGERRRQAIEQLEEEALGDDHDHERGPDRELDRAFVELPQKPDRLEARSDAKQTRNLSGVRGVR